MKLPAEQNSKAGTTTERETTRFGREWDSYVSKNGSARAKRSPKTANLNFMFNRIIGYADSIHGG